MFVLQVLRLHASNETRVAAVVPNQTACRIFRSFVGDRSTEVDKRAGLQPKLVLATCPCCQVFLMHHCWLILTYQSMSKKIGQKIGCTLFSYSWKCPLTHTRRQERQETREKTWKRKRERGKWERDRVLVNKKKRKTEVESVISASNLR